MDRRTVLKLAGATTLAATAGCLDSVGLGDDGATTAYDRWLKMAGDEGEWELFFVYLDVTGLDESDDSEDIEDDTEDIDELDDPMLAMPMGGLLFFALLLGFGGEPSGLAGLSDLDDEDGDFGSSVDEILTVNEAIIYQGSIDTDEIHERLVDPPESDDEWTGRDEFEALGEYNGVSVYEELDDGDDDGWFDDSDPTYVGVTDEYIVFGVDERDTLEAVIDTVNGDGDRARDEVEAMDWAIDEAGDGHIVFGGYGTFEPDDTDDDFGGDDFDDDWDDDFGGDDFDDDWDDDFGGDDFDDGSYNDDWNTGWAEASDSHANAVRLHATASTTDEAFDGTTGLVSTLSFDDGGARATLAMVMDAPQDEIDDYLASEGVGDLAELIEEDEGGELGGTADSITIDVGDDRVSANAAWDVYPFAEY